MEGFWKQQLCFSCSHISLILALHSHASGSGGSVPQLPGSSRAMSLCSSAVLWESCINQDGFFFLLFFFFHLFFFYKHKEVYCQVLWPLLGFCLSRYPESLMLFLLSPL